MMFRVSNRWRVLRVPISEVFAVARNVARCVVNRWTVGRGRFDIGEALHAKRLRARFADSGAADLPPDAVALILAH